VTPHSYLSNCSSYPVLDGPQSKTTYNNTEYIFLIRLVIQSEFQVWLKLPNLKLVSNEEDPSNAPALVKIPVDSQLSSSTEIIWIIVSKKLILLLR
jgi:hypothetical protein